MNSDDDINFEPLGDYLLVEPLPKNMTDGGIALPESAESLGPDRGRVLRAGPGRITEDGALIPMSVKAGDLIYLACNARHAPPIAFPHKGKMFAVVRLRDVIATTEKTNEDMTVIMTLKDQTDAELAA